MRILMLNNEFPPLGGGMATVNEAILQYLSNFPELDIDLITSGISSTLPQEQLWPKISVYRVLVNNRCLHHATNSELIKYSVKALWLAYQLHRRYSYDLCFAWSTYPAGAVAYALSLFTRIPFFVRVCGPDIPSFEARYDSFHRWAKPLTKLIWRYARGVIAKCQTEADLVTAVDASITPIILPNGAQTTNSGPLPEIPEAGALRLICVARLIERKGQTVLFETLAELKDKGITLELDLLGTGDAEAQYKERVAKLGLSDAVRFHGYVPRERINDFYSAAHIFVLPSLNEGMSVAALEALAAGLPLVVSDCPGMECLVKEEVNGYILPAGNSAALARCLTHLNSSRSLLRDMCKNSRNFSHSFSWEGVAKQYHKLFLGLANK